MYSQALGRRGRLKAFRDSALGFRASDRSTFFRNSSSYRSQSSDALSCMSLAHLVVITDTCSLGLRILLRVVAEFHLLCFRRRDMKSSAKSCEGRKPTKSPTTRCAWWIWRKTTQRLRRGLDCPQSSGLESFRGTLRFGMGGFPETPVSLN